MATRTKIAELLAIAATQCPAGAPTDRDSKRLVLESWVDLFADVEDGALAAAVKAHALDPERGRFFPIASDLARHLPRPPALPELADADAEAWERICATGWYGTAPALDDVQQAAWDHVGGRWATSGRGDAEADNVKIAIATRRRRFLAFCATRRTEALRPALPPPPDRLAIPDIPGAGALRALLGGDDPHAEARARHLAADRARSSA